MCLSTSWRHSRSDHCISGQISPGTRWVVPIERLDALEKSWIACPCREPNQDFSYFCPSAWSVFRLNCYGFHFVICIRTLLYSIVFNNGKKRLLRVCRSQCPRSAVARLLGLRVRIRTAHGCLSLFSVACHQVAVPVMGRSLAQRSPPPECGVTECDLDISTMRRPWPTRDFYATGGKRRWV